MSHNDDPWKLPGRHGPSDRQAPPGGRVGAPRARMPAPAATVTGAVTSRTVRLGSSNGFKFRPALSQAERLSLHWAHWVAGSAPIGTEVGLDHCQAGV